MFKKNEKLLIISLIVFLGITFPLAEASANGAALTILFGIGAAIKAAFGEFARIMGKVTYFLFKVLLLLILSQLLLFFANAFLAWASDPNLIKVGILENPFVLMGWEVVRDFVNLFFILIVVFIGIATALRIKEYEIQKLWPRLIFVALLINFTPAISGLLIGASNVVMDFFFQAGGGGGFVGIIRPATDVFGGLGEAIRFVFADIDGKLGGGMIFRMFFLTTFNLVTSFILITLSLVFIIRHVVLWVLVILSPLAFFSYILPATKTMFWDKWWNEFIKWSFIGVVAMFFLWLAHIMIAELPILLDDPSALALGLDAGLAGILTLSLPLALLCIGLMSLSSISIQGMNLGKMAGGLRRTVEGKAKSLYKREAPGMWNRVSAPAREEVGKWAEGVGMKAPPEKGEKGRVGYHIRKKIAGKVSPHAQGKTTKDIEALTGENKELTRGGRNLALRNAKNKIERISAILSKFEKGETSDLTSSEIEQGMEAASNSYPSQLNKMNGMAPDIALKNEKKYAKQVEELREAGDDKAANKIQEKMEQMGLILSNKDKEKGYKRLSDKLADGIKAKDISSLRIESFENEEYAESFFKHGTGEKFSAMGRELNRPGLEIIQKKINETEPERLKTEYPALHKFSTSNVAASSGLVGSKSKESGNKPPKILTPEKKAKPRKTSKEYGRKDGKITEYERQGGGGPIAGGN